MRRSHTPRSTRGRWWRSSCAGTKKIVFKDDSKLPQLPKPIHVPQDHFMNRLQWGLASVLAGMGATANWHRIVLPWLRGGVEKVP